MKKIFIILFCTLILFMSHTAFGAYARRHSNKIGIIYPGITSTQQYINESGVYYQMGLYDEAEFFYSHAITKDPRCIDAYMGRAKSKAAQFKLIEATNDYNYILMKLNGNYIPALMERATLYRNTRNDVGALRDYNKIIKLSPNNAEAYLGRGLLYYNMKKNTYAISDLEKAKSLYTKNNNKYAMIDSFINYQVKKTSKATTIDQYMNLAAICYNLGSYLDAKNYYSLVIQKNSQNKNAYLYRAAVFSKLYNYSLAINDYNYLLIKIDNRNLAALLSRAKVYKETKNFTEAVYEYNNIIKLYPDNADAYAGRGIAYYYIGHLNNTLNDLEKAKNLYNRGSNKYNLTDALIKQLQYEYFMNKKKVGVS